MGGSIGYTATASLGVGDPCGELLTVIAGNFDNGNRVTCCRAALAFDLVAVLLTLTCVRSAVAVSASQVLLGHLRVFTTSRHARHLRRIHRPRAVTHTTGKRCADRLYGGPFEPFLGPTLPATLLSQPADGAEAA
jgi:hypothetical protein